MRLTVLLLAALAGALVCAQDPTTVDYTEEATTEDSLSSEPETTAAMKSASLQESATATQKTLGATQNAPQMQDQDPLEFMVEKSLFLAEKSFDGAEKRVNERIQDGKKLVEGAADFIQKLKEVFLDPSKWWF